MLTYILKRDTMDDTRQWYTRINLTNTKINLILEPNKLNNAATEEFTLNAKRKGEIRLKTME